MGLVWKHRRGSTWYLSYAKSLSRPTRSLKTDNAKVAEMIRAKEENDLLLGAHGIKYSPSKSVEFSLLIHAFIQAKKNEGRSTSTLRTYTLSLNAFGSWLGDDRKSGKVTPAQVEQFLGDRREKGVQPKSLRNDLTTLHTMFEWGIRHGLVGQNPCKSVVSPKVEKRPPDHLREAEYQALMKGLPDAYMQDIVDFYILTGCRRGEGLAVKISRDIDWDRGVIDLPQRKQGDYRSLPITEQLKKVLKRLIRQRNQGNVNDPDLLIPLTGPALYNRFYRAQRNAGLKRRIRIHSLRHTFGTWLGGRGTAPRTLQALMGHHSLATTEKYTHGMDETYRRELEKLRLPSHRRHGK